MSQRGFIAVALALAIGLALFASPYASGSPDGLARVAADTGIAGTARTDAIQDRSPLPGYGFPGVRDPRLAKGLAGFAGTLAAFALGYGGAALLRRRRPARAPDRTVSA
jgi:PDGLE domain